MGIAAWGGCNDCDASTSERLAPALPAFPASHRREFSPSDKAL